MRRILIVTAASEQVHSDKELDRLLFELGALELLVIGTAAAIFMIRVQPATLSHPRRTPRMTELTRTPVYRTRVQGYTAGARVSARDSDRGSPMQTQHHPSTSDRLGREGHQVHAAVRFGALAGAAGLAFLIVGALWDSTCKGAMSVDTVACGAPQLTILAFGAPVILLAAGVWAFVRTYRVWRDHGVWWAWQGAGWFLMILMFVTLTMGAPIAGPVLAG